jgi:hypothetical protein|tara:strand:+ start:246 stop:419 length:174 start_codon:yes stop_codon:yes gene_type:complete
MNRDWAKTAQLPLYLIMRDPETGTMKDYVITTEQERGAFLNEVWFADERRAESERTA